MPKPVLTSIFDVQHTGELASRPTEPRWWGNVPGGRSSRRPGWMRRADHQLAAAVPLVTVRMSKNIRENNHALTHSLANQGLDSAIQSQWDRPSKAGFIQMHYDQCQIFALERLINYDFISRIEAQVYVQLEVGW